MGCCILSGAMIFTIEHAWSRAIQLIIGKDILPHGKIRIYAACKVPLHWELNNTITRACRAPCTDRSHATWQPGQAVMNLCCNCHGWRLHFLHYLLVKVVRMLMKVRSNEIAEVWTDTNGIQSQIWMLMSKEREFRIRVACHHSIGEEDGEGNTCQCHQLLCSGPRMWCLVRYGNIDKWKGWACVL